LETDIVVVGIGNELLDGRVVNTNLVWLGERLEQEGYSISRAIILRDDVQEICKRLAQVIAERPGMIIVTGGLGPTWDDVTLQSMACALGVQLRVNDVALGMIKSRIRGRLTPERRKMAFLPEGSEPLKNTKGTAPGVYCGKGGIKIVALPGVPEEMKGLFEREVLKIIRHNLRGERRATSRIVVKGIPEADLAPIVDRVRTNIGGIYIKSHVKYSEKGLSPIEVFLSCRGRGSRSKIKKGMQMLKSLAIKAGGQVTRRASASVL
jgi:nicotinamide-nucleotide amidase